MQNVSISRRREHVARHGLSMLSLYNEAPRVEVSLEQFEEFAIDRLHVLKAVENYRLRSVQMKDREGRLDKTLNKHLPLRAAASRRAGQTEDDAVKDVHFLETASRTFSADAVEMINWHQAGEAMTDTGGALFTTRARAVAARGDWHLWVNTYSIVNKAGGYLSGGRGDKLAVLADAPGEELQGPRGELVSVLLEAVRRVDDRRGHGPFREPVEQRAMDLGHGGRRLAGSHHGQDAGTAHAKNPSAACSSIASASSTGCWAWMS